MISISGDETVPNVNLRTAERVLHEIVSTEKSYVMDLVLLVTHYYRPTLAAGYLAEGQLRGIFLNAEALLAVHASLMKRFGSTPTLRSVVEAYRDTSAEMVREYGTFASGYSMSHAILRSPKLSKDFIAFCHKAESSPVCKSLTLVDFLIKPIQRICKYPLLFRELIRHLSDGHPLTSICQDVQVAMDRVASLVNHAREKSECDKLLASIDFGAQESLVRAGMSGLSEERKLVRSSSLLVFGTSQKRSVFLLTDLIFICSPHKQQSGKYVLRQALPVDGSLYIDILLPLSWGSEQKAVLKLSCAADGCYYFFEFQSHNDASEWVVSLSAMKQKHLWACNFNERVYSGEELERRVLEEVAERKSESEPPSSHSKAGVKQKKKESSVAAGKSSKGYLELQDETTHGVADIVEANAALSPRLKKRKDKEMKKYRMKKWN